MFELIRTCEHLELIAKPEEQATINAYAWECAQEDTTPEERYAYILSLLGKGLPLGRYYEPHCKKNNGLCVVMESPVLAMRQTGGLFQPIAVITTGSSSRRMEKCQSRELPEANLDGMEPLDVFLLRHIKRS